MANESVWIDLDEVQASAKTITGLLKELEGPANQLEAVVKQVQASVYGTDLLGKSLQGSGSSAGGLGEHQEQVLGGIKVLMHNATAMGENLRTMAERHKANDENVAAELSGITGTGTTPASPVMAGLRSGTITSPVSRIAPSGDLGPESTARMAPHLGPVASVPVDSATPAADPITPPPPIAPISVPDAGVGYKDPNAPDLEYNHHSDHESSRSDRPAGGSHQVI